MRLYLLLISFLQVALVGSLRDVSGYLGGDVTLPSGADPSWKLTKIVWSIFSNNTWIATYRSEKTNTERVDRYRGRLSLNTSSGDLTIHSLTAEDAMEYTVDLINAEGKSHPNKVKLIVNQRLQKPTIDVQTGACTFIKGGCCIKLHCSTTDKGANVSWQGKPPGVTVFDKRNPDGNSAVLLVFLNTTQNDVEFTCTSSRDKETTSRNSIHKCDVVSDDNPQPLSQTRSRNAVFFFIGVFLGILLTTILKYFFGEQIKAAWEYIRELARRP